MSTLAPVRWSLVAIILGAAGTAVAQEAPRAKCPQPETGACPPTETPMVEPAPAPPPQPAPIEEAPTMTPTSSLRPAYTTAPPTSLRPAGRGRALERYGLAVSAGGGVSGFTANTMRDTTNDGGAWGVRLEVGTSSRLAIETAYIGSAQSIDALGLETDAVLVGNGVQAGLRVNLLDASSIQPFGFAGIAWRHYSLSSEGLNTSDIADDDDVLEIPVGVGFGWKYRGLLLDARGEFRMAAREDMVPSLTGVDTASMHRYGVTANAGYTF